MGLLTEYDEPGLPKLRPQDAKKGWVEVQYGVPGNRHVFVFTPDCHILEQKYQVKKDPITKKTSEFLVVAVSGALSPFYVVEFPRVRGEDPFASEEEVIGGAYISTVTAAPAVEPKDWPWPGTPPTSPPKPPIVEVDTPIDPWATKPKTPVPVKKKKKETFALGNGLGTDGLAGPTFGSLLGSAFPAGSGGPSRRGSTPGRSTSASDPSGVSGTGHGASGSDGDMPWGVWGGPDSGGSDSGGAKSGVDGPRAIVVTHGDPGGRQSRDDADAPADEGAEVEETGGEVTNEDGSTSHAGSQVRKKDYPNPADDSSLADIGEPVSMVVTATATRLASMGRRYRGPRSDGPMNDDTSLASADVDWSMIGFDPTVDPTPYAGAVLAGGMGPAAIRDDYTGAVSATNGSGGGSTSGLRPSAVGAGGGPILAFRPDMDSPTDRGKVDEATMLVDRFTTIPGSSGDVPGAGGDPAAMRSSTPAVGGSGSTIGTIGGMALLGGAMVSINQGVGKVQPGAVAGTYRRR